MAELQSLIRKGAIDALLSDGQALGAVTDTAEAAQDPMPGAGGMQYIPSVAPGAPAMPFDIRDKLNSAGVKVATQVYLPDIDAPLRRNGVAIAVDSTLITLDADDWYNISVSAIPLNASEVWRYVDPGEDPIDNWGFDADALADCKVSFAASNPGGDSDTYGFNVKLAHYESDGRSMQDSHGALSDAGNSEAKSFPWGAIFPWGIISISGQVVTFATGKVKVSPSIGATSVPPPGWISTAQVALTLGTSGDIYVYATWARPSYSSGGIGGLALESSATFPTDSESILHFLLYTFSQPAVSGGDVTIKSVDYIAPRVGEMGV